MNPSARRPKARTAYRETLRAGTAEATSYSRFRCVPLRLNWTAEMHVRTKSLGSGLQHVEVKHAHINLNP